MDRRSFIKLGSVAGSVLGGPRWTQGDERIAGAYLREIRPGLLAWLESVRFKDFGWGRWKYNVRMYRDFGLESSAQAIQMLESIGALDDIPGSEKHEAITFLKSCFDPSTGYLIDPLVKEKDHTGGNHSWEHIWSHMDGVAKGALERLGAPVREGPVKTAAPFCDLSEGGGVKWLLDQPWERPWMVAEHMLRVIKWHWEQLPEEKRVNDEPKIKELFEAFEARVLDPETGMPTRLGCRSRENAMAGAFKAYIAYLLVGREIPFAEEAVDFVLDLQRSDGSFGESRVEEPKPLTIHWDSLWNLRELNRQLRNSHRFEAIRDAGNRCARYLMERHLKFDGGFSYGRDSCLPVHNSIKVSPELPVGDTTGGSMSLKCLAYADEWNRI